MKEALACARGRHLMRPLQLRGLGLSQCRLRAQVIHLENRFYEYTHERLCKALDKSRRFLQVVWLFQIELCDFEHERLDVMNTFRFCHERLDAS